MKRLIIVRHGKSDRSDVSIADIDRPLKKKGIDDAYIIASRLKEQEIIPDLIISSHAVRAISTAIIFARVLKFDFSKFHINENIYEKDEDDIIEEICLTDNGIKVLMIVGHNPSFTNLANTFISKKIDNLPTSGVVIIDFDTDRWEEIKKFNRIAEKFEFPKN
jgi:phosphohistidine phosphatase